MVDKSDGRQISHPFNQGFFGEWEAAGSIPSSDSVNLTESERVIVYTSDADNFSATEEGSTSASPTRRDYINIAESEVVDVTISSVDAGSSVDGELDVNSRRLLGSEYIVVTDNYSFDVFWQESDYLSVSESETPHVVFYSSDYATATESEREGRLRFSSDNITGVDSESIEATTHSSDDIFVEYSGGVQTPPLVELIRTREDERITIHHYDEDSVEFEEVVVAARLKRSSDSATGSESERIAEFIGIRVGFGYTAYMQRERMLTALWKMDGRRTSINDESGWNNHATAHNVNYVRPLTSGLWSAASLNGTNAYIAAPRSATLNFAGESFTLEGWINPRSDGSIISQGDSWDVWLEDGEIHALIRDRYDNEVEGILAEDIEFGKTYHIAVVINRSLGLAYMYLNGERSGSFDIYGLRKLDNNDSLPPGFYDETSIGRGPHGYINATVGEFSVMVGSVTQTSVRERYNKYTSYANYDYTIESRIPAVYFSFEDDELTYAEMSVDSEVTDVGLNADRAAGLLWSGVGSAAKINSGGLALEPFDVQFLEFIASSDSQNEELIFQRTGVAGDTLSVFITEDYVIFEESYGTESERRTYQYDGDWVYVACGITATTSIHFINGYRRGDMLVPQDSPRSAPDAIHLFSTDETAGYTGYVDSLAMYDKQLSAQVVEEHYFVSHTGRYYVRVDDLPESQGVEELGFSVLNYDWTEQPA